jgi:hypothetical protein
MTFVYSANIYKIRDLYFLPVLLYSCIEAECEKTKEYCAADFSLLNLPKGKSLGRSKPATNS